LFANEIDCSIKDPFSRIFCDTERFSEDEEEVTVQFGMGVLYEKTDDGKLLRKVAPELRTRILNQFYRKHHDHLT
jgi:N-formylglutamate deformylase